MPIAYKKYLACACLLTILPLCAHAQTPIPSVADPSRVAPKADTLTPQIEEVRPPQEKPPQAVAVIDNKAAKKTFLMKDLAVDGMTAYSIDELKNQYAAYFGMRVSLKQIFEMAAKLQQRYVDDGYTLTKVDVPKQKSGTIRLIVTEGYVAEIELKDATEDNFVVQDLIRQIKLMRPLNVKRLERLMLVMNEMQGSKMSSILAKPTEPKPAPGALRLIIEQAKEKRVTGSVGFNNYGSLYSGPWQAVGGIDITDVGIEYGTLSLMSTVAKPLSELFYGRVAYETPIFGASGTKLNLSYSDAENAPGEDLAASDVQGYSREAAIGISYPIILQRDKTWRVNGKFSVKNARTDFLGDRLYEDRIRVLSLGSGYAFSDHFRGANGIEVKYAQGFDIWGARESGMVDLSRAEGQSDFRKFQVSIGRQQALPKNFEAYFKFDSQYTNDALLSSEEFGFGGADLGRGYDPSEITGDRGMAASIELRYNMAIEKYSVLLQPYAFYDIGKVWNIDPGAEDKTSAASTGFGVRSNIASNWNTDLNLSIPLTLPASHPPKYSTDKGIRALLSVIRVF